MTMTDPNDDMLDDLFAEARGVNPQVSDDLTARVLVDAGAAQEAAPAPKSVAQPGLWSRLMDMVGGWPSVGGLAAATVAGIWIGVAPPASVENLTASLVGDSVSVSLLGGADAIETGFLADG